MFVDASAVHKFINYGVQADFSSQIDQLIGAFDNGNNGIEADTHAGRILFDTADSPLVQMLRDGYVNLEYSVNGGITGTTQT